jgi:hypothetical protein
MEYIPSTAETKTLVVNLLRPVGQTVLTGPGIGNGRIRFDGLMLE